ncbi:Endoribonuclease [Lachnellula hyalina]|uniref:Endoribonuclease n=1 Tax=Lachnellula hyalina TaxID=1316788 RepID=A0A8H8TYW8_9HELO|nr:Endoribonuclease [Lachnellula hyalina]TVY27639.1 Endoribonuclease [Lachnellula hyalina]
MTHPTKAIYKWLIQDSIRVGGASATSQPLYTEADHLSTFPQIEAIDYHTTHTISSIRITPYPAGHVLGAAMFLIEIAGLKLFFTGDYSREDDRHLVSAEVPKGVKIDVLITESTYGIATHVPRLEREQALMKSITGILNRGGRVLMPVFALGRAQELLLILDEYWSRHAEFQKIPIYYASNLARKCMLVYQTYISAMNDNIKRIFKERMAEAEASADTVGKSMGPWDFEYIRSLKNLDRFDDVGSCVMLATPGMLQNGVSRELLERWAPNPQNGVIITGYSVEGTMAKHIVQEPDQIQAIMSRGNGAARRGPGAGDSDKVMIPRRCSVQEYSFAAHVDGTENREFIEDVAAPVVILVHGEQHNMMRLKSKLLSLNADKTNKVKVFSPRNCEELRIPFKADKIAKVVGKLASLPPPSNIEDSQSQLITGVLVQNDFKMSLMAPEDLREYAGLTTTTITCKQRMTLSAAGIELIKWALEGTFGSIEELPDSKSKAQNGDTHMNGSSEDADEEISRQLTAYLVMDCVTVRHSSNGDVELEWEGNMLNDGIADAIMAVLFSVESSPAAVKQSSSKHSHSHTLPTKNAHANLTPFERFERLSMFLEAQFGPENLQPIKLPRVSQTKAIAPASPSTLKDGGEDDASEGSEDEDALQREELERLHKIGIPVPGVEIKVDKMVAKVWLEDLEVECTNRVFGDRVRAVVERAVEVTAPLWAS